MPSRTKNKKMFIILSTFDHNLSQLLLRFYWLRHFVVHNYKRYLLYAGLTLSLVVTIQLVFPSSLTSPRTYIGGKAYGMQSKASVISRINEINSKEATVVLQDKLISTDLASMGLTIDGEATVQKATSYRWYERLLPFSLLSTNNQSDFVLTTIDEAKASNFAKSLNQYNSSAVDASVKLENLQVTVDPSKNGFEYKTEVVKSSLPRDTLPSNLAVSIPAAVSKPAIPTEAAQNAAAAITARLVPVTVTAGEHTISISPETIASWIEIQKDTTRGKINVTYSRDKVKLALNTFKSKLYISQVANTITLVDGEVSASTGGAKGQMLQLESSTDAVIAAVTTNQKSASAVVQAITPQTVFNRSYTRSSKGIQALIDEWVKTHSGVYGVSFRYLAGGISADASGNRQFTSASIYKLYVADVVYNKVQNGELTLDTATSTGASVASCIDAMIVRSDNNCAIALGSMIGWNANVGFLRSQGFGSTNLISGGFLTTASDTADLLVKLQNGTLVPTSSASSLISMMGRQIYRAGIPAGSAGSVANKVGFLGGLNHDAAIVYHPKGSYALVVMSSGSSFSAIADLARQISTIMNQ